MQIKIIKCLIILLTVYFVFVFHGYTAVWIVGTSTDSWKNNVMHSNTTLVQSTGNIELRQLSDDYVSYWRFDEGAGITARDENTNNNNNATLTNEGTGTIPTYTDGRFGKALQFYGDGGFVNCGNDASLNITSMITIEVWGKVPSSVVSSVMFVCKGFSAGGYYFYPGKIRLYSAGLGLEENRSDSTPDNYDGIWHHFAITYDGASIKYYRDGSDAGIVLDSDGMILYSDGLVLGKYYGTTPPDYMNGCLDEVRIYNRVLSQTEINQTMNNEHYNSGSLTSIIQDAELFGGLYAAWKQISFNAVIPQNTSVDLYVKTSFDNGINDPWTDWILVNTNALSGTIYDLPLKNRERYSQWKLELKTNDVSLTPEIQSVSFISGSIAMLKEGKKISVGPNPFTPGHPPYDKVTFNIDNPGNKNITLEIYNLESRLVFKRNFGPSELIYWDGIDLDGRKSQDGIYIYQITIGNTVHNGKLVLAR